MSRSFTIGAMLVVLAVAGCGSPTAPGGSVESQVQAFVGSGAKNCGRLAKTASEEQMQSALSCGLDAARAGAAFSVVREYQGIDSAVAQGLLGRTGGSMFKFLYDGGTPGGQQIFEMQACGNPHLVTQGNQIFFGC